MFNVEEQTQLSGMRIFLRPKESVNVPFKYQCFKADQSVQTQVRERVGKRDMLVVRDEELKGGPGQSSLG